MFATISSVHKNRKKLFWILHVSIKYNCENYFRTSVDHARSKKYLLIFDLPKITTASD